MLIILLFSRITTTNALEKILQIIGKLKISLHIPANYESRDFE